MKTPRFSITLWTGRSTDRVVSKKCKSLCDSIYIKFKETKMNSVLFRNTYTLDETTTTKKTKEMINGIQEERGWNRRA